MAATADPLSRLVVDEAAVDRELLATVLEDKIRLDLGRGTFTFQQGVRTRLNNRHQVLVALLAQKALHLLAEQYPEALQPREIEALTGVKPGTLRPILKQFSDNRVVRQNTERAYYIPGYSLEDAARIFNERGD
jgi:hypothetical protein